MSEEVSDVKEAVVEKKLSDMNSVELTALIKAREDAHKLSQTKLRRLQACVEDEEKRAK